MQDVLKPRVDESTLSLGRVFVVVVEVVVFVAFLAGSCSVRSVSSPLKLWEARSRLYQNQNQNQKSFGLRKENLVSKLNFASKYQ